jgi:tetratricopeptide (TPR) repeat protein
VAVVTAPRLRLFGPIRAVILAAVALASAGTGRAQSVAVIVPPAGAAREAWQALEEARYKDAEAAFSRALTSTPDDPALLVGSAIVARRLGHTPEAKHALARALQIDPGMTPASQLLGTLLYESGDTEGAIRVYEAALFRKPDNQPMLARVEEWRKEAALHDGFQRARGGHFSVLFEGQAEQQLAGVAVDILEEAYGRIGDFLQVYPAEAVTVILYTQQQFRDVTRTPGWSGGLFDGRIRLPVRGGLEDRDELERVLTHEYVHALLFSIAATGVPAWLNEGLATALEPGGLVRARQQLSRARAPIPLADLRRSFAALSADRVPLAYSESALVVQAMLDRAGAARLVGLLKDLAAGTPFEPAFASWIQVSIDDFEREWAERARDSASSGRHRDPR